MPRGRPRKSLEHHLATGAIAKNPKRFKARMDELVAEAVSLKPSDAFMGKSPSATEKRKIWNDLVATAEPGTLRPYDKFFLEQLAGAIYDSRTMGATSRHRRLAVELLKEYSLLPTERWQADAGSRVPPASDHGDTGEFGEFAS